VALAAWSWGTWPDVLVDFGRELYVPWRLAQGDVLYRDVASFYGPLSPYVNAAAFRLFGTGLRTLALLNLALLALAAELLRALLRRAGAGRATALAAVAVFLCVFGFGHLLTNGSFNFVAPYAHEATHGFVLAAAALACVLRLFDAPPVPWALAAGVLCGLAFLTKPEGFVAALGACAVALLARMRQGEALPRTIVPAFAGGLLAPPLIAFALLATAMPVEEAFTGTLGSWAFVDNAQLRGLGYFAWSMGLDDPGRHLGLMGRAAAVQVALFGAAAGAAWLLRGHPRAARPAGVVAAVATVAALAPFWRARAWLAAARPLTLWTAALAAIGAAWLWRLPGDAPERSTAAARLALATFALLLLPRIAFNARAYHYGFVLAAPAAVLLVAALLEWIPAALARRGAAAGVFRGVAAGTLAVMVAFHLAESHAHMERKQVALGTGGDRFLADARGSYVEGALEVLARVARPGETLVVLPEGVMLNYLHRLPSSIPYLTMLPSDEAKFGEDELLGALQRDPPALVALVHRDTSEFGPRFFGRDYAQRTMGWLRAHYAPQATVGDAPLQPEARFGIQVLRRRADDPAEAP
jgi:4-amino-4-deoxy-L-arabinose transferase-like glycosyltransferase